MEREKIKEVYDNFEEFALGISLAVTVIVIFVQVIARKVFNSSLSWSEELARYLFIWQCWLGVSLAYKNNSHIRLDMIIGKFKGKNRHIAEIVILLITLLFNIFLIKIGMDYVYSAMRLKSTGTVIKVPLGLIFLSVPFSSLIISFRLIGFIKEEFAKIISPEVSN